MDKCSTDAEFDSYWDNEAKNTNRNRIRVGRQYQASIPPLLKPGEKDGRKSAELETLKWKPDQLTDQQIEEYLYMAKGVGLFSKSLGSNASDHTLQSALKGLSEFVTSHHPCHHDDGCKVATPSSSGESTAKAPSDWSPSEAQLFAQAIESCGKNFCAIKKEFLPWKPVRSIIEYYYQGKSEKPEVQLETHDTKSPKKEDDPGPSCSKDEKPCIKDEPSQDGSPSAEEPPNSAAVNFLENTRVTDPCGAVFEHKMTINENDLSTVGSLKFFLGGRLVLKLNAQQDSGSGTKCQWVQSSDLPKHSGVRKERHRKKSIQEGTPPESKQRKAEPPPIKVTDRGLIAKKPKLKSEYDFPQDDKGLLLCSASWTPPVADGQEPIEVDDGSSKTSEGYISPVLRSELNDERFGNSPDCARTLVRGSPNGSPFKPEVLNHKSALRSPVRSLCHRSSPLLKTWSKWPAYPVNSSSPSSLSPVSVVDLKSPMKENPLDLTSKGDPVLENSNHQTKLPRSELELDSSQSSCFGPRGESTRKDSSKAASPQCEGVPKGVCCPLEQDSEDPSHPQYRNLPYHCALSKCTKEQSLEEVPLDLSSASESLKDRTEIPETLSENANDGPLQNTEAVERGMLYQLLKNNSSK